VLRAAAINGLGLGWVGQLAGKCLNGQAAEGYTMYGIGMFGVREFCGRAEVGLGRWVGRGEDAGEQRAM
jgi:hypothetical protein